jgi:thiamine kinase-like enzyme
MRSDGTILKTDATSHGDDHFFPGPTDIAWDLAGAIVEWEMDSEAAEFLTSRYARLSNDDPRPRLPAFLLAYTVFRMGYCKMACEAEAGSAEEMRLRCAYQRYRNRAQRLANPGANWRRHASTAIAIA